MIQYKIEISKVVGRRRWKAWIEGIPGAKIVDARSPEQAVRWIKAKALSLLSVMVESGQIEIERFEISQCCHPEIKLPIGWRYCSICDQSVPFADNKKRIQ